ncbi:nucleotide exchange factor GrpE [Candidatus Peregrinibacteria bacterium]|nr:nucleotide exchange factor GrpE [Candidatus Peregrinibacteria bacterium]
MTDKKAQKKKKEKTPTEYEKTKKELEQMTELAKRTMADLENLKRRHEEERKQIFMMANAELIKELLPIIDNLNLAKKHIPENAEEWYKGIEMSIDQMNKIFQEFGLAEIVSKEKPFNPDLHEAVAQGPGEKDMVIEEIEKGYMLGNRVIRHAKVKVGNGKNP